jgi:hypothetical protein
MKGKIIFSTMLVFLLAFGLLFVSCPEAEMDSGGGKDDYYDFYQLSEGNTITIYGEARVGQKLTATSEGYNFVTGSSFEWAYWDTDALHAHNETLINRGMKNISGANDSELTIDSDLVGKYIRVQRKLNRDYMGKPYYMGAITGPVWKE